MDDINTEPVMALIEETMPFRATSSLDDNIEIPSNAFKSLSLYIEVC